MNTKTIQRLDAIKKNMRPIHTLTKSFLHIGKSRHNFNLHAKQKCFRTLFGKIKSKYIRVRNTNVVSRHFDRGKYLLYT